jgi:hypothetical protein
LIVAVAPELRADLRELGGPERQDERVAAVAPRRVARVIRFVVPKAREPAAPELILAPHVVAVRAHGARGRLALGKRPLGADEDRPVEPLLERLPAERGVDSREGRVKAGALEIVRARPRPAELEVRVLGKIAVGLEMKERLDVVARVGLEEVPRRAPEELRRGLEENLRRHRDEAREAEAGILDAVLAAEEVRHVQGRVGKQAHVQVLGIELAESALEPAHLEDEVPRNRQEGDGALLDSDVPLLAPERDEEVRAREGIHDGLQADLRLAELKARLVVDFVVPDDAERVADHGDVRIEDVAGGGILRGGRMRREQGKREKNRNCLRR